MHDLSLFSQSWLQISKLCMQWLSWLCLNISDITSITVKNCDYFCILDYICKSEAINLLESVVLEKRRFIKKYCLCSRVYCLFKSILSLFKSFIL